jgi:hypothetical protein
MHAESVRCMTVKVVFLPAGPQSQKVNQGPGLEARCNMCTTDPRNPPPISSFLSAVKRNASLYLSVPPKNQATRYQAIPLRTMSRNDFDISSPWSLLHGCPLT